MVMKKSLFFLTIFAVLLQGCEKVVDNDWYEITISDIKGDVSGVETVTVNFLTINLTDYHGYPFDASGMTFKFPRRVAMELNQVENLFPGAVDAKKAGWGQVDFFGYDGDKVIGRFDCDFTDYEYWTIVQYVYVDRDVKVKGFSDKQPFGYDVDLTLKAGWNPISVKVRLAGDENGKRVDMYRNGIPRGACWRFVRF